MCTGSAPRHMARRIKLFGALWLALSHPICWFGRHEHYRPVG